MVGQWLGNLGYINMVGWVEELAVFNKLEDHLDILREVPEEASKCSLLSHCIIP